jgi:peptidoglycan/LPS O-acetylase OafA/YrhL
VKPSPEEDALELRRETAHHARPSPTSPRQQHLPALDGIRGLAVLMVFLVHYGGGASSPNLLLRTIGLTVQAGWIGVTLFFILSGFLISGILWDSRNTPRWWTNFYARRTLRIFPLYYASLLLVWITAAFAGHARSSLSGLWIYVLYLQNIPLNFNAGDIGSPLWLSHFWSLAVEEQFYLLWPFLLIRMKTLDQARRLCIAVFFLSAAFRILAWYFLQAPVDPALPTHRVFHGAYGFLFSRAGELAIGSYLAMCFRQPAAWARLRASAPLIFFFALAAFLASAVATHTLDLENASGFMVGLPAATIFLAALLVLSLGQGIVNKFARLTPLRWLGGISYGFYIFHVLFTPLFTWVVEKIAPHASHNVALGLNFLVAGSLSILFAWLSFRFFESRFLKLRVRYRTPEPANL